MVTLHCGKRKELRLDTTKENKFSVILHWLLFKMTSIFL